MQYPVLQQTNPKGEREMKFLQKLEEVINNISSVQSSMFQPKTRELVIKRHGSDVKIKHYRDNEYEVSSGGYNTYSIPQGVNLTQKAFNFFLQISDMRSGKIFSGYDFDDSFEDDVKLLKLLEKLAEFYTIDVSSKYPYDFYSVGGTYGVTIHIEEVTCEDDNDDTLMMIELETHCGVVTRVPLNDSKLFSKVKDIIELALKWNPSNSSKVGESLEEIALMNIEEGDWISVPEKEPDIVREDHYDEDGANFEISSLWRL